MCNRAATTTLLEQSAPFLWDVTLEDERLSVCFDALPRVPGPSKLGDFHYIPIFVHKAERPSQHQRLLLDLCGIILGPLQGRKPSAEQIDLYHLQPSLQRILPQRMVRPRNARIVDQNVDAAQPRPRSLHGRTDSRRIGDVHGHSLHRAEGRQVVSRAGERLGGTIPQADGGARGGQASGNSASDALGGARDDGNALPESSGRHPSLYFGGMSKGIGGAGGATAEEVEGGKVTGGGGTGGEATTGGVTAHPMMVLSIPRPRHITHRRETIGRTPFVGQFT